MQNFGEYLRQLRTSKGLTVNQVATYSGISAAQLSRIENGKRGTPKPSTIAKLAAALKVNYVDLMIAAGHVPEFNDGDQIETNNSDLDALSNDPSLSPEDKILVRQIKELPEDKKKLVKDLLNAFGKELEK